MKSSIIYSLIIGSMALGTAQAGQGTHYNCRGLLGVGPFFHLYSSTDGKAQALYDGHVLQGSFTTEIDDAPYLQKFSYNLSDEQGQSAALGVTISEVIGRGGTGRGGSLDRKSINANLNYQGQETLFACNIVASN